MRHWLPCGLVTMLLLLAGGAPSAQTEDPRFEFVSVRRVPPACGLIEFSQRCDRQVPPPATWRAFPGGRLEVTNQPAIDLVRVAYGLERFHPRHLSGGPGWLKSDRYDIIALTGADGRPGQRSEILTAQVRLMLRALLEDRFKLRVRIVPKKTDVVVLRRSDSNAFGPGLKVSSGECREPSSAWGLPPCVVYENGRIDATDISMAELADVFSRVAAVGPVLDETGIKGRYDVSIELRPADLTLDRWREVPSVAASVQRALGLEWQRAKRVIDRVEIRSAQRPADD